MALSNAERERLHRQRTKDKLATTGETKRTPAAMRSAGPFSDAEFTADEKLMVLRGKVDDAQRSIAYALRPRNKVSPDILNECRCDLRLWQELIRDYERLVGAPDGYVTLDDDEHVADEERGPKSISACTAASCRRELWTSRRSRLRSGRCSLGGISIPRKPRVETGPWGG
jgi:hypothetical protein